MTSPLTADAVDDGKPANGEVANSKTVPTPAPPSEKVLIVATQAVEAVIAQRAKQVSLAGLVSIGTVVVIVVGGALFGWLSWLLSHQPAPWHDHRGIWAWLSSVDGPALFDAARITATILAIIGVGGAALVAYRRQATAEQTYQFTVRAHAVALDAQKTAAAQLLLDSQKYELDRERHELETQRRIDDRERELRARFGTIAQQLGADQKAVRHAAVYALAALADDWHGLGNDVERQACVDLFCAQLRSPRVPELDPEDPFAVSSGYADDTEIRTAMIAVLRSHRPLHARSDDSWASCSIDLSGADLTGFYLNDTDLSSAILVKANLSRTNMTNADLSEAQMLHAILTNADFSDAVMIGARLSGVIAEQTNQQRQVGDSYSVTFDGANLRDAWFTAARLPSADFTEAKLTGARFAAAELKGAFFLDADCTGARFRSADLSDAVFIRAKLYGASLVSINLASASFESARHDGTTKWPKDFDPPGSGSPVDPDELALES